MAIRPSDLQGAIFQATQTAPLTQRSEEGPRAAQAAAQTTFAAHLEAREETVAETARAEGSTIDANAERRRERPDGTRRRRGPGADAATDDPDEPPHLIDVRA